jgi:hypothetical protein
MNSDAAVVCGTLSGKLVELALGCSHFVDHAVFTSGSSSSLREVRAGLRDLDAPLLKPCSSSDACHRERPALSGAVGRRDASRVSDLKRVTPLSSLRPVSLCSPVCIAEPMDFHRRCWWWMECRAA